MKKRKRLRLLRKFAFLLLAAACLLAGCGQANNASSSPSSTNSVSTVSATDQSAFMWRISVDAHEVKEALDSVGTTTLYDGTVREIPYNDKPQSGKSFLLLKLTIQKAAPGNASFDWKDIVVVDASGTEYTRQENDSFLSNHSYDRLPGTSLKLGDTSGWICFEVDSAAGKNSLWLLHKAKEGENKILIQ